MQYAFGIAYVGYNGISIPLSGSDQPYLFTFGQFASLNAEPDGSCLTICSFGPGTPASPSRLGNTNSSYRTRDWTAFEWVGRSEAFSDWYENFYFQYVNSTGNGSGANLPVLTPDGELATNLEVATLFAWNLNTLNSASGYLQKNPSPLIGIGSATNVFPGSAGGTTILSIADNGAAALLSSQAIPWGARCDGGILTLFTGGLALPPTVLPLRPIHAWAFAFGAAMNAALGPGAMATGWGLVTRDRGIFWLKGNGPQGYNLCTITASSIAFGPDAPLPPILFNALSQNAVNGAAVFQLGDLIVVLPAWGAWADYNNIDPTAVLYTSADLVNFRQSIAVRPFADALAAENVANYNNAYIVATSGTEVFFEVTTQYNAVTGNNDSHVIWAWNPATDSWRLARDWSVQFDPAYNTFFMQGVDATNGVWGWATRDTLCLTDCNGPQDVAPNYELSVGLLALNADPLITKVGYASTRNFVLNKRQMAYFQRLGMIRLIQEYL